MNTRHIIGHPFEPVFDSRSTILILGSFPSERSRLEGFYYGHPSNRFWNVLSAVYEDYPAPKKIEEKKYFILRHELALWDVLQSCSIIGSSDASIADAVPNDILRLMQATKIRKIFCNGKTAYRIFQRYCSETCGLPAEELPSTSAANASFSLQKLIQEWSVFRDA